MSREVIVSGSKQSWSLIEKIGEGDAGEVFLVKSIVDSNIGILKRPLYSAFSGDIVRQAFQIEQEGKALSSLERQNNNNQFICTPKLLDQSKSGTALTDRFFIVITKADGFDLKFLSEAIHHGKIDKIKNYISYQDINILDIYMLEQIIHQKKIPDLLLLRLISEIIQFLEKIHSIQDSSPDQPTGGIIWNDIKPEHIFWSPIKNSITLIDWGNVKFIDPSGKSEDRQHSHFDDFSQLIDEMGTFLIKNSPELYADLEWPTNLSPSNIYSSGIKNLKNAIQNQLDKKLPDLNQTREKENAEIEAVPIGIDQFIQLINIQKKLTLYGELPNLFATKNKFYHLANVFLSNNDLEIFSHLCTQARNINTINQEAITIFQKIIELDIPFDTKIKSLNFGINEEWSSLLWELRSNTLDDVSPLWWDEISQRVREITIVSDIRNPKIELNRVLLSLKEINNLKENTPTKIKDLIETINNINQRWVECEPDPPNSDLLYSEISDKLAEINEIIPDSINNLIRSLESSTKQVEIVLDNWSKKEFGTAQLGLRQVFLWDPYRNRVFAADAAIQSAHDWLLRIQNGPEQDEPLIEFITRLELEGREIRIRTAPAPWLDTLLSVFRQLRKNSDPTEVLMKNKGEISELSWLLELDPNRPIFTEHNIGIKIERKNIKTVLDPIIFGITNGKLGEGQAISLLSPLDIWVPEAKGSSARVFLGDLRGIKNSIHQAAVKIMRPELIEYALPLFKEEVHILTILRDIPGVIPLLESGFIRTTWNKMLPSDNSVFRAADISGEVIRYGRDSVHNYLRDIDSYTNQGWLPYLAIEKLNHKDNLLKIFDIGYNKGRFTPIIEGLRIAIQICDILIETHARNIVYRDHKILHFYWNEEQNGIYIIDWNIAKHYPEGLSNEEIQFDLVQFGARGLHHIFTGRPAPGALPIGPNRPEEIESAARKYDLQWTYDDQRLPNYIKELLERVLSSEYYQVRTLRNDLYNLFRDLTELKNNDSSVSIPNYENMKGN